jgi:hypothetical protein
MIIIGLSRMNFRLYRHATMSKSAQKKEPPAGVALNGHQLFVIYGTSWLIRVAQFP